LKKKVRERRRWKLLWLVAIFSALNKRPKVDKTVRKYLAKIGSKGGKKSRRILTPEQARAMVKVREKKRKAETPCPKTATK